MSPLIEALADVRSCWSPTLSPAGDQIAFVSDMGGDACAYVSPTAQWKPTPIVLDGLIASSVAWSRDDVGSRLLVAASPPGSLRAVLSIVDPDGGNLRHVDGPAGGTAFSGCWAPGSPAYAFSAVGPENAEAVLLNVVTGSRRLLAEGGGLLVQDVTADGARSLLRTGPRGRRHLIVADALGRLVRVLPRDLVGGSENGRFLNNRSALWMQSNSEREFFALVEVPLTTTAEGQVSVGPASVVAARDDAELEWWRVSNDERLAVLVWNVGGISEIEVLDSATGSRSLVEGLPEGVVTGLDLDAEGSLAVVEWSSSREPRSLWMFEISGIVAHRPFRFSEEVDSVEVAVSPVNCVFAAHDGIELSGWLYRPAGAAAPLPTVVSLHGGPEAQSRPEFSPLVQALVASGVAVFAPNVRGSSGFGRTFVELDSGLRRLDAVRDVATAARWLVAQGIADPGRLGVHGTSYGGYLVLAAIVAEPDLFAAAASVCGISDFLTFFAGTEPWIAAAARTKYGDPAVDVALLRELSPLQRLPSARTPTLLVHGMEDTNVPIGEARAAHAALLAGGVESELVELPGEGHSMLRPESRLVEMTSIVNWFGRLL